MTGYEALYVEINLISIVLLIILYGRASNLKQLKASSHFLRALIYTGVFIIADALAFLMIQNVIIHNDFSILLAKSIYFVASTCMGYSWFLYFEFRGDTYIAKNKKVYVGFQVFLWIHIIMTLFNFKYGFFFSVAENGAYIRGNLFFLQYVFCYAYVGIAILRAAYAAIFATNYIDKSYVITLALFPIIPAIAGLAQFVWPQIPLACFCMTLSATMLYYNDLDETMYIDPLTGLLNRRTILNKISKKMKDFDKEDSLFLVMMDVDYFKHINDNYGHVEGDRALEKIAEAIKKGTINYSKYVNAGRFGGDEFIMIVDAKKNFNVDKLLEDIEKTLQKIKEDEQLPYVLQMSMGYAKYDKSLKRVHDFVDYADGELYKIKEEHHKKNN